MAGAELVADIGVVLRARIDILDQERDGRAGRELALHPLVLEHAGENANRVGLFALADIFRLAGTPAVEIGLDVGFVSAMPGGQPSTTQPIAGRGFRRRS
jgi:hypothetical protein